MLSFFLTVIILNCFLKVFHGLARFVNCINYIVLYCSKNFECYGLKKNVVLRFMIPFIDKKI